MRNRFALLIALVLTWISPATHAATIPLDESCVVSILNRSARVAADGTWRIDNVPANFGLVRVRATCVKNGVTMSGQSDFISLEADINNGFSPFGLGNATPIPSTILLTAPSTTLNGVNATVQLTVTATYPDASTRNISAAGTGTSYTVSSPATATISPDGLVSAKASGTVVVSAINEGAIGLILLHVQLTGDSDGDGIPDDVEIAHGLNPNNPVDAQEDPDRDGLTNFQELMVYGTNPRVADTDGDGISDGDEVSGKLGFVTNPLSADTDGDGIRDLLEIQSGSNPNDPASINLAQALQSLEVRPSSVVLTVNSIIGEASRQLVVTGHLKDGTTINLASTSRGTTYGSSDLFIANFGSPDGRVFAGNDGHAIVTVSNGGFSDTVDVVVKTFTPVALSALSIPGYANNVDVSGNFAYVAAGSAGLQVVDVSNPAAPLIVGAHSTPGNANDVRIVGNTAYVADGSAGLTLLDVSTPGAPAIIGNVDTPGEAQDVMVIGNRAYVADGAGGLQIIDVGNPAAPAILGSIATLGPAKGVDVSGNLAVVAEGSPSSAVTVFDVSNAASPTLLGSVALPGGEPKDLVVRNNQAYVAAFTGGFQVVDFSTPTNPRIIGGLPGSSPLGFVPRDVQLSGRFALAAEQLFPNVVPIVDVSDPANPIFRTTIDFEPLGDYAGTGIALNQQYVFMTGESFIVRTENGSTGNTRLFIGQYLALEDNGGIPPVVAITAPAPGAQIIEGNTIRIQVSAEDDVGVAAVTFLVNGQAAFTDIAPPFQFDFTVPAGVPTVSFGAQATDFGGNIANAAPVTATVVPSPPPSVGLSSPAIGATLIEGETITLRATATDDGAVVSVVFVVNGVPQPPDTTAPYEVSFTVPNGINSLTVKATATDNVGQQASDTRTVAVIPDPLTRVIGTVVGVDNLPVEGAVVKVFNTFSSVTDMAGAFHIDQVPTILGPVIVKATAVQAGVSLSGSSLPLAAVRGGVSDVGQIVVRNSVRHVLLLGNNPPDLAFTKAEFSTVMPDFVIETLDAQEAVPTLAFLAQFDVVLLFENELLGNSATVGSVVFDYLQQGGNVVIGTFYWQARSDGGFGLSWGALETVDPFTTVGTPYSQGNLNPASLIPHPLTQGLTSLFVSNYRGSVAAKPGTTVVARWSDGVPLIGYKILPGGQRFVGVSLFPANNAHASSTGDFLKVWKNALLWAGEP